MQTTFTSLTFAEILRDLYVEERTGLLVVERGSLAKSIYFDRGIILFAGSNLDGEDLGRRLVAESRISAGALVEARSSVSEPIDVPQALVNRGLIGKEALSQTVTSIIARVVGSVFQWDGGSARFSDGGVIPEVFDSDILSTFEVILGGIDAMAGFDPIREVLKGLDNRLQWRIPSPVPLDRLSLSPSQGFVLSRVDGQASPSDVLSLLPPGQDDPACRFLYGLLVLGVLRFDPPVGSGAFRIGAIMNDDAEAVALERAQEAMVLDAVAELRDRNPHEVLGVASNADRGVIERAYEDAKARFGRDRIAPRVQDKLRAELSLIESRLVEAYLMLTQVRASDLAPVEAAAHAAKEPVTAGGVLVRLELDKTQIQVDAAETVKIAESYFSKARKFQREADFHNAIQYAKLAISYVADDARFMQFLGECQAKNPDLRWQRLAEQNFTRACELDPWNADYRVTLGVFYKRRGLKLRARKQFEEALQLVPTHVAALTELEALS